MPAGRPLAFDDDKKTIFCKLLAIGCSRQAAARCVGVSPFTVTRHMLDHPDFVEEVRAAERAVVEEVLATLFAAAKKNWRAAAWLLPRLNAIRGTLPGKGKDATAGDLFEQAQYNTLERLTRFDDAEYASALAREEMRVRLRNGKKPIDYGDPNGMHYEVNAENLEYHRRSGRWPAADTPSHSGAHDGDDGAATETLQDVCRQRSEAEGQAAGPATAERPVCDEPSGPLVSRLAGEPRVAENVPLPATSGPPADRLTAVHDAVPAVSSAEPEAGVTTKPPVPSRPSQSPLDAPNYALPPSIKSPDFPTLSAPETRSGGT